MSVSTNDVAVPAKMPATRQKVRKTPSAWRFDGGTRPGPCIMATLAIQPFVTARAEMKKRGKISGLNNFGTDQFSVETLQAAMKGIKAKRSIATRRSSLPLGGVFGCIDARCRPIKSPTLNSKKRVGDQSAPNAPLELSIALVIAGKTQSVATNVTITVKR